MRRTRPLIVVSLAAVVLAASCGTDTGTTATSPTTPDKDKVATGQGQAGAKPAPASVTIIVPKDTDTFDPHTSLGEDGAQQLLPFLYDPMVRRDLEGKILPGIATKWETTTTSGVFTIRDGMTCADGAPLDAAAVAKSFEHFSTNKAAKGRTRVFGVAGAESIVADPAAKTVTIKLKSPNNDMLTGLANSGFVICPGGVDNPDIMKTTGAGSGPYTLVESKRGEKYVMNLRTDYVALPEGTTLADMPKTVTLQVVTEDATAADLVEKNAGFVAGLQSTDVTRLKANAALTLVEGQAYGTNAVVFAQGPGAKMGDVKLRQGIAMLIDSQQGAAAETQNLGIPRRTLFTPNIDCYNADAEGYAPKYDPAAGATFLDEAGYKKGADGFRTKPDGSALLINVVGDNTQYKAPDYLAKALTDGGFNVKLAVGTRSESIVALLAGNFDVGSFPFTSSTPLPALWLNQIGTGNGDNYTGVSNPEFDAAANTALAAEGEARCVAWKEAERAVLEQVNVLPLDQPIKYWFGNGVTFNARFYKIDPFSIRGK